MKSVYTFFLALFCAGFLFASDDEVQTWDVATQTPVSAVFMGENGYCPRSVAKAAGRNILQSIHDGMAEERGILGSIFGGKGCLKSGKTSAAKRSMVVRDALAIVAGQGDWKCRDWGENPVAWLMAERATLSALPEELRYRVLSYLLPKNLSELAINNWLFTPLSDGLNEVFNTHDTNPTALGALGYVDLPAPRVAVSKIEFNHSETHLVSIVDGWVMGWDIKQKKAKLWSGENESESGPYEDTYLWPFGYAMSLKDHSQIWLLDIDGNKQIELTVNMPVAPGVHFSRDVKFLTLLREDIDEVLRFDTSTWSAVPSCVGSTGKPLSKLHISYDERSVLKELQKEDRSVVCFGPFLSEFSTPSGKVGCLYFNNAYKACFNPDGLSFAVALSTKSIAIYRIVDETFSKLHVGETAVFDNDVSYLQYDKSLVSALEYSNDGKVLAAGFEDGDLLLWDIENDCFNRFKAHSGAIDCLKWSHDDSTLVSCAGLDPVRMWNAGGPNKSFIGQLRALREDLTYNVVVPTVGDCANNTWRNVKVKMTTRPVDLLNLYFLSQLMAKRSAQDKQTVGETFVKLFDPEGVGIGSIAWMYHNHRGEDRVRLDGQMPETVSLYRQWYKSLRRGRR